MRIFIALGGLVVALLLAVLVVPYFVDWTAFRDEFEREAGRILGRDVTVQGSASAKLLPFPSLTFEDVVVDAADGTPFMTLSSFSMDAELAPYLSGEIRIFQMRLDEPHLTIPLSAKGGRSVAPVPVAGLPDSTVILENVEVSGGRITFTDGSGAVRHQLANIDAELSARTLSGPFSGGGTLVADGEPLSFTLGSGAIGEDGTWPLRLGVSSERLDAAFSFDGTTRLGDGSPDFSGSLEVASPFGEEAAERLLPPIRVTSAIEISESVAELSEARVEVGEADEPYLMTGSGSVIFAPEPRYDLELSGEQVDVDRIAGEALAEGRAVTFHDRVEAARATLAAIPDFGIEGEVHLSLPVVTAGDTTIRNSIFTGSQTPTGWRIRDLSAELPGRTLLEASGNLAVGETLGFEGDLLLASRQVGGFANWLSGRVDPKLASLQRAGFAATVDLSSQRQLFESLEVDVGGERLFGRMERSGNGTDADTIAADLSGEAVDLDAFLAFARLFGDGSGVLAGAGSLDVRFDAGPVLYDGMSAGSVNADLAYSAGLLDLRNLLVDDLEGASIEARGTVAGLPERPTPELAFEVSAQDPRGLFDLLAQRLTESPVVDAVRDRAGRLGPLRLSGTTALPIEDGAPALTLRLDGTAAGTALDLALSLENGLDAARVNGRFGFEARASNPDPLELAGQFGFAGFDLGVPTPLSVELKLSGEAGTPVATSLLARAPGSSLSADGTIELGATGIDSAELSMRSRSEDAAPWLAVAGLALGQGFDALPLDLAGRLAWFEGDWTLSEIAGDVAGRAVDAELRATAEGGVVGSANVSALSLPWLATLAYGTDPTLANASGWPDQPFGTTLLNTRPLVLDLKADRLQIAEEQAVADFSARLRAGEGSLAAERLAGRFAGGALSGSAEFRQSGGLGSLAADLQLEKARLGAEQAAAEGAFGGQITVEGSGRSYAEIAGSLTGEGELCLEEGSIGGVGTGIFAEILDRTSADGFAIDSENVGEVVSTLSTERRFPVSGFAAPLELALGELRLAPVPIAQHESSQLSGGGTFDLAESTIEATLVQRFLPDEDERLPETEPAVTFTLQGGPRAPFTVASVEPLTAYLSARRLKREEERLEAIREDLRETLRLRREARLYSYRDAERERLAAERERIEAERIEAEEAERAAAAAAEAEREAAAREAREAAEQERRDAASQFDAPAPAASPTPPLNFDLTSPSTSDTAPAPPASAPLDFDLTPRSPAPGAQRQPGEYGGLPGVQPPIDF